MHKLVHNTAYRVLQLLRGRPVGHAMRMLADCDLLDGHSYRALAQARLVRMLEHARQYVPLYSSDAWSSRVPVDRCAAIDAWPVLDRHFLIEQPKALRAAGFGAGCLTRRSSASTGTPVSVGWTRLAVAASWAAEYHPMRWHGLDIGVATLRLWGSANRLENWVLNREFFPAHGLTAAELERALRYLSTRRPPLIWGVPSAVLQLARYAIQQQPARYRLARYVKVGGEQVYPFQRAEMQRAFGARVIEAYGATEVGPIAAECPMGSLHVLATNVHLEIFHGNEPAPLGELGDIVVTTLVNKATPLVRCRIGDSGRLSPEPCACGLPQPVLAELRGRTADLLTTVDGTPVHASILGFALGRYIRKPPLGAVRQIQFEQVSQRHWRVEVQADERADTAALGCQLEELLSETVGQGCTIDVQLVPKIAREPSGKFRYYRAGSASPAPGTFARGEPVALRAAPRDVESRC